jgi:hypothetical protein
VANNGSGIGTLNLGALNDSGAASTLRFSGNGIIGLIASGNLSAASSVIINASATLQIGANNALGVNSIPIANSGTLVASANQTIGNLGGTGSLVVGINSASSNTLMLGTSTGGSSVSAVTINGNAALDLNNNHLIINFTGNDPIATIRQYLMNGYNGGSWNGPAGINSSAAASNPNYALGYADGSDNVVMGLLPGQIEIAYTLIGDANLDGAVNGSDFAILAANFNKAVNSWDQGDFNYDGSVNGSDFAALAANFNHGASGASVAIAPTSDMAALEAFATANGVLVDVPEPVSFAMLCLGIVSTSARRRSLSRETNRSGGLI